MKRRWVYLRRMRLKPLQEIKMQVAVQQRNEGEVRVAC